MNTEVPGYFATTIGDLSKSTRIEDSDKFVLKDPESGKKILFHLVKVCGSFDDQTTLSDNGSSIECKCDFPVCIGERVQVQGSFLGSSIAVDTVQTLSDADDDLLITDGILTQEEDKQTLYSLILHNTDVTWSKLCSMFSGTQERLRAIIEKLESDGSIYQIDGEFFAY